MNDDPNKPTPEIEEIVRRAEKLAPYNNSQREQFRIVQQNLKAMAQPRLVYDSAQATPNRRARRAQKARTR